ncbi:phytanoyl-CoA dioxygenase family protein [Hwanghaeella sp.]|uniref:phytanoyl-CoA dioxygenase family protein n=1 Tax=Hwanghaeella sp. TaxID=2605943 RepID=UPI003CCBB7CE
MPLTLSQDEIDAFNRDGYLLLKNAVDAEQLTAMRAQFDEWVEESRKHADNFGETINGKPRFDLEPGHNADHPRLRRVNAPVEAGSAYRETMEDSRMTDAVADLIGPNVKFHHSKINSKLPHTNTEVKYHQDFTYTPHSNPDVVTALVMLDDTDAENGCLMVVPGSHQGELYSLWHGGRFTGAVAEELAPEMARKAVPVMGKAGDACLMHTRVVHGSAPNRSDKRRVLSIFVYTAEDAVPLSPNPMPNVDEGRVVRGERTGRIRSVAFDLQAPELPQGTSFFEQQERA